MDTPEWKHNAVAEVHMAAAQALDGLGWAGLGWAGLGWAGLGWAVVAAGGSALNMKIHRQMYR